MSRPLPTPSDAAARAASGVQPVHEVGPVAPSDRGRGYFFERFPPDGWNYFHASYVRAVTPADIGALATILIPNTPTIIPFVGQSGQVFLVTDWQFHAWRLGAAGEDVPLERNDVVALLSFKFLIDNSPARTMIYSNGPVAAGVTPGDQQGFPYLNTRPGPGLQSPQFSLVAPVKAGQRVTAEARVLAVPLAFQYTMLGFEFSGMQTSESAYGQMMSRAF